MKEARDRLAATNREKENMEDAIIRQREYRPHLPLYTSCRESSLLIG